MHTPIPAQNPSRVPPTEAERRRCLDLLARLTPAQAEEWLEEGRQMLRSPKQNRLMWAILAEISSRVPVQGRRVDSAVWKEAFALELFQEKGWPADPAKPPRTSRFSTGLMSDLIELMTAFAALNGIQSWTWEARP